MIGHCHDAIDVPLVQLLERFADRCPSRIIREPIAARRDANCKKVNYLAFPR